MAEPFQDAVAYLQKTSSMTGQSLFDHLTGVIAKVLEERPEGAVDLLETSLLVKRTAFLPNSTDVKPLVEKPVDTDKAKQTVDLYGTPEPDIDPDSGEPIPAPAPNDYETEDFLAQAALFESVGAGLGRTEMYAASQAVRRLGEDPDAKVATVRFFGKVLGSQKDYYVFEATLKEPVEDEDAAALEPPPEAYGTGTNAFTYFVTPHLGAKCVALPNVTPAQIVASRGVKKFLTGDLEAEVAVYPPFPGTEKSYLRALLTRIAIDTVLVPANLFVAEGDDESGYTVAKAEAEDYTPQAAEDMLAASSWVHRYQQIKPQGRCAFWAKPVEDDAEDAPEVEPEVSNPPLTGIDTDPEIGAGTPTPAPAWTPIVSSNIASAKFKVAAIRSNLWPGAVSVYAGANTGSIYVGFGVDVTPFKPPQPPAPVGEYAAELKEQTELPPPPPEPEPVPVEGEEGAEGEEEEEES